MTLVGSCPWHDLQSSPFPPFPTPSPLRHRKDAVLAALSSGPWTNGSRCYRWSAAGGWFAWCFARQPVKRKMNRTSFPIQTLPSQCWIPKNPTTIVWFEAPHHGLTNGLRPSKGIEATRTLVVVHHMPIVQCYEARPTSLTQCDSGRFVGCCNSCMRGVDGIWG